MGMEQSRELHAMHRERLAAAEAKWVRALLVRDGFGFVPGCTVALSMRWSTPPTELREARQDGAGRGLTLSDTCGLGRGQRPRGWQTPLHRLRPITQRGSRLSGSALRKSRVQGRRN
jgi:hypothetical protein